MTGCQKSYFPPKRLSVSDSFLTMLRRVFSTACPSSIPRAVNGILPYLKLGTVPYGKALALQRHLVQRRHDLNNDTANSTDSTIRDILILVEHPPTFTAGRRFKGKSELEEETRLKQLGAEYYETLRGGQITFHGPGQLVSYPILDIRDYQVRTIVLH
jgi:lipoate-protein ligase B